ncbi:hypothetical protein Pelo_3223 [Pelomyxa schiedti]|nr:hypothetical protein Pelo_3223 [Pelomyxa schiedti]
MKLVFDEWGDILIDCGLPSPDAVAADFLSPRCSDGPGPTFELVAVLKPSTAHDARRDGEGCPEGEEGTAGAAADLVGTVGVDDEADSIAGFHFPPGVAQGGTWLVNVLVVPRWRGRGVARLLVQRALQMVRSHNDEARLANQPITARKTELPAVYLWCEKKLVPFYSSFGFVPFLELYLHHLADTAIFMWLDLRS